jgi:glycosyltransferase involved in cell wall biosynthesis
MHHPLSPFKLRLIQALRVPGRFDKILVLSYAEAVALADKLGFQHDEIGVLRFPTDTQFYEPPAETPPLSEQNHIESLGASYRDYPTLMRAMTRLPNITCYVRVGSLWTKDVSGNNDASVPDNIQLQPYVPPIKLRDCYTQSRFIVVPIRNTSHWSAGSSTVQQAQAMGKAVIATRLPGLSEYVLDGETGILVDVGDDQAMAEAINELWNNPQKTQAMGRRAREWIVSNFSLDQWVNQVSNLLQP